MNNNLSLQLSHQTFPLTEPIDPFYAYLALTQELGEGQVFLLDAAAESHALYNTSLVAATPIVEVQVKDGLVSLVAQEPFMAYILEAMHQNRYVPESQQVTMDSVIKGHPRQFQPEDCMAFLEILRQSLRRLFGDTNLTPFSQGFLGYIGYDAVHYLEQLPKTTVDDRHLPDIRLQWHGAVVHILKDRLDLYSVQMPSLSQMQQTGLSVGTREEEASSDLGNLVAALQERVEQTQTAVGNWIQAAPQKPDVLTSDVETGLPVRQHPTHLATREDVSQADFEASVEKAKEYIVAGDIFQVVLSKRIRLAKQMHHYDVYEKLRHVNPSPYMFMVEYPDSRLIGASPEVQFRAVRGEAEMKPIAGTSKGRGKTPEEDRALEKRLLADEKERAEHLMLVDLCRNDLGRVSEIGSVHVEDFMVVEPYSHLFHLVSTVKSQLQPSVSVFRALLSTFPAGTLSGAPKIRAMEIIDELETYRRGPYGGMIGMVDFDANANTAIVIRTIVEVNDEYFIQVGAGIVADSIPEQEWLECGHKSGALLAVLAELEPSK